MYNARLTNTQGAWSGWEYTTNHYGALKSPFLLEINKKILNILLTYCLDYGILKTVKEEPLKQEAIK